MEKEKQLTKRQINDGALLPFTDLTERLGRAGFQICAQYKRGKVVKLSIYPRQQEDMSYFYEWEGEGRSQFSVQSYGGLAEPKVWQFAWCKEHKCQTFSVYVPPKSKYIRFEVFSFGLTIAFVGTP